MSAWAQMLLTILGQVITFGGGVTVALITQRHADKRQQVEIDDSQLKDINTIKDEVRKSIEELKDMVNEIKASCQEQIAITTVKLDAIEKKQDKYNDVIHRTYESERRIAVLENRNSVSEHRIDDLEKRKDA